MPLEPGKIILLCGTSTAGKTSICGAAQVEARKTGHAWIVDGADVASEKAWTEPSEAGGKKYLSAQDHFVSAMKTHTKPSIVDAAVNVFGVRTLAVALFSRRNLGNPKVDQVDLTPEKDIKVQAQRIYNALSAENKAQYTPDSIENLLSIIRDCPDVGEFFKQHPYPPLQQLNEHMLERAITRAKKGESTILDIIGNETIDGQPMVDQFQIRLGDAGLCDGAGMVVLAHCPVNTLIDRIDSRNKKAADEGRPEEARLSFFPFDQYGAIYKKAPALPDSMKPIVGTVTRQDIITAAKKFGSGNDDAKSLLDKLGFVDEEKSVSVISRVQSDITFQTGVQSPQQIAEQLCEKAFGNTPALIKTADSKKATELSRESCSTVAIVKSLGVPSVPVSRAKAHPAEPDSKSSQITAISTRGENKEPEAAEPGYEEFTASSSAKEREKYTPLPMTPKPPGK